ESNCGKSGGKRKFGVAKSHRPNREVIISAFLSPIDWKQTLLANRASSLRPSRVRRVLCGRLFPAKGAKAAKEGFTSFINPYFHPVFWLIKQLTYQ
ncbi:MAG: hypothetical protein SH848_09405, partial [Saprospiraceae bacterium]|nr:hypothetical protein [Saprospiraceae bacterium]MDZ4704134.1 hypothetical protein [Saprospiraceae bacterium]